MAHIGVFAASSIVPRHEVEFSMQWLKKQGHTITLADNLFSVDWGYAGNDSLRAQSFIKLAYNKKIDILWAARGGYGATHLLPMIEQYTIRRGRPKKKSLIGFSDVTALLVFCQKKWGFQCVHGPMLGSRTFTHSNKSETTKLNAIVAKQIITKQSIQLDCKGKTHTINNLPIFGGNLAVWCSLLGTRFEAKLIKPHVLFLEDISESPARILRMLHQLLQSGNLKHTKAIVLGEFTDCKDASPLGVQDKSDLQGDKETLLSPEFKKQLAPIRKVLSEKAALEQVILRFYEQSKIPILMNFPSGHGNLNYPIIFGEKITINKNGLIKI
jgi:muramoyltetrapeptide carboxypeptidase